MGKRKPRVIRKDKITIIIILFLSALNTYISDTEATVPAQCIHHHENNFVKDRRWPIVAIGFLKGCQSRKQWLVRKESSREDQNSHGNQQIGDQHRPIAWDDSHPTLDSAHRTDPDRVTPQYTQLKSAIRRQGRRRNSRNKNQHQG